MSDKETLERAGKAAEAKEAAANGSRADGKGEAPYWQVALSQIVSLSIFFLLWSWLCSGDGETIRVYVIVFAPLIFAMAILISKAQAGIVRFVVGLLVVSIGFPIGLLLSELLSDGAEVTEEDRQAVAERQAAAVAERVCVAPVERAARRVGGILSEADRRRRFRFERLWPEYGRKFPDLRWRANDLPGPYPRDARRLAVVSGSGMVFNGGFAASPVGPGDDWLGPNRRLVERGLSMWLQVTYSCTLDMSVNPARVLDVDVSATKTTGYDQICTHDMQTCTDVRE